MKNCVQNIIVKTLVVVFAGSILNLTKKEPIWSFSVLMWRKRFPQKKLSMMF